MLSFTARVSPASGRGSPRETRATASAASATTAARGRTVIHASGRALDSMASQARGAERGLLVVAELLDRGLVVGEEREVVGQPEAGRADVQARPPERELAPPVEELVGTHLEEPDLVERTEKPRLREVGCAAEAV